MNKTIVCLSGILVLISFTALLIFLGLGSVSYFEVNANFTIPIIVSALGILIGTDVCYHLYKRQK